MSKFNYMSDEEIVIFMQKNNDSEEALNVLIERHSGICIDMINSFLSKSYNNSLREELIKEKDYLIYSSALKYKKNLYLIGLYLVYGHLWEPLLVFL